MKDTEKESGSTSIIPNKRQFISFLCLWLQLFYCSH